MRPNKQHEIVLGIDPGLATTGWGVVEKNAAAISLRGFGAIEVSPRLSLPQRLVTIRQALSLLIDQYKPTVVAIEELFFAKFARTIAGTAQARGAILLTLADHGLPIVEYNPRAVKMATTGFGSAEKIQIQSMVQRYFKLPELPRPDDAADALAIALCHLQTTSQLVTSRAMVPSLQKALTAAGVKV